MIKGHWSFPKGHIKQGETEEQATLREIKEETNLDVEIIDGFKESISYMSKTNTTKIITYFLTKPKSLIIKRQKKEIKSVRWFKYENAFDILTYENDKELLKKAKFQINNPQGN